MLSYFSDTSLMQDILTYKQYNSNRDDVCDIIDGQLYKDRFTKTGYFKNEGTRTDELHISLQMDTDGVSLFRSSTFSIWPVYFVINELPPHIRY